MAKKFSISQIKPLITNLAQTSHYQVIFGGLPNELLQYLSIRGVTSSFISESAGLLCSSASLPTSSLATKTIDGNYTGIQEKFATAKIYDDITLEFYVDSDYKSLIFLETWIDFISSGSHNNGTTTFSSVNPPVRQTEEGYFIRMQYPDLYKSSETRIIKFDRNYGREMEYKFVGLFPYAISQIPVSYGASDILKVSASFKYDRYIVGKTLSINYFQGDATKIQKNQTTTTRPTSPPLVPRSPGALGTPGVGFVPQDRRIPVPGNPIREPGTNRII